MCFCPWKATSCMDVLRGGAKSPVSALALKGDIQSACSLCGLGEETRDWAVEITFSLCRNLQTAHITTSDAERCNEKGTLFVNHSSLYFDGTQPVISGFTTKEQELQA